jgi:hypothetical protein
MTNKWRFEMKKVTKATMKLMLAVSAVGLLASAAYAAPISLSDAQMDSVAAGVAPSPTGFVCPVITTAAVLHSPRGAAIGEGHYTILGPEVSVPMHATNDNGAGVPEGPHAQPGDSFYTAIWYFQD